MALLLFLCITYTTPWDSYLIKHKYWTYLPERVLFSIYRIPIEEYFFFVIQTIIGCAVTAYFLKKNPTSSSSFAISQSISRLMVFFVFAFLMIGIIAALKIDSSLSYLRLVLGWSLPIIALQIFVGKKILHAHFKTVVLSIGLMTLYFWFADSIAIVERIWEFPPQTISGFKILGTLPIEEALFFAATNTMVVQGYLLFTRTDSLKLVR